MPHFVSNDHFYIIIRSHNNASWWFCSQNTHKQIRASALMKVNSNESSIEISDILHTHVLGKKKFFIPSQIKSSPKKTWNFRGLGRVFCRKSSFFAIPNVNFLHMKLYSYCVEKRERDREKHVVMPCISEFVWNCSHRATGIYTFFLLSLSRLGSINKLKSLINF